MVRKHLGPEQRKFFAASLGAAVLVLAAAVWYQAPLLPDADGPARPASSSTLLEAARVDLNTAGLQELCTLPGIGRKTAWAILEDRRLNGPYAQVEDVTRVDGITQNIIGDWGRLAYVSGPPDRSGEEQG